VDSLGADGADPDGIAEPALALGLGATVPEGAAESDGAALGGAHSCSGLVFSPQTA
jgi:hypothetical protein